MEKFIENVSSILETLNSKLLFIKKTENGFDIKLFLKQAKDIMGDSYLNLLLDNCIIVPDGKSFEFSDNIIEYKGCTLNYQKVSENRYQSVIILLDPTNLESQRIGYHELAHLFQTSDCGLKAINTFYNFSKRFYTHYLEEAHAEVFAAACILNDAENKKDFEDRKAFLIKQAKIDEELGKGCDDNIYPSPKYYAHFSLIDKFVTKSETLLKEQSYQTLSKICENHVLRYAKSECDFIG